MSEHCWHQRQLQELAAARERVAALDGKIMEDLFARLRLCYERTAEADWAMAQGDYETGIALLQEELLDECAPQ